MKKMSFLIVVLFVALIATALKKGPSSPSDSQETAEATTQDHLVQVQTSPTESTKPKLSTTDAKQLDVKANPHVGFFNEAFTRLPKNSDLKDTNRDGFHHRPQAVQEAADLMGKVAAHLEKNPKSLKAALKFYEKCAQREEVLFSVRALCLRNLMDRNPGQKSRLSSFAPELIEIANRIPSN